VGGCARRSIGPGGTRTSSDPSLPSAGPMSSPRRCPPVRRRRRQGFRPVTGRIGDGGTRRFGPSTSVEFAPEVEVLSLGSFQCSAQGLGFVPMLFLEVRDLGALPVVNPTSWRAGLPGQLETCPLPTHGCGCPRRRRFGWWSPTCCWAASRSTGSGSGRPASLPGSSGWLPARSTSARQAGRSERAEQARDPFSDDDRRQVGVCGRDRRHDRRVRDVEALDPIQARPDR